MYKLIIRLDVEFVALISLGLAPGNRVDFALAARLRFVFVTKLLTNNNRQRNVLLTRSISLSLFECVCVLNKQQVQSLSLTKSLSVLSVLNCAYIHIYEWFHWIHRNAHTYTHTSIPPLFLINHNLHTYACIFKKTKVASVLKEICDSKVQWKHLSKLKLESFSYSEGQKISTAHVC